MKWVKRQTQDLNINDFQVFFLVIGDKEFRLNISILELEISVVTNQT